MKGEYKVGNRRYKIGNYGTIYELINGKYHFVSVQKIDETELEAIARIEAVRQEYDRIQEEEIEE